MNKELKEYILKLKDTEIQKIFRELQINYPSFTKKENNIPRSESENLKFFLFKYITSRHLNNQIETFELIQNPTTKNLNILKNLEVPKRANTRTGFLDFNFSNNTNTKEEIYELSETPKVKWR